MSRSRPARAGVLPRRTAPPPAQADARLVARVGRRQRQGRLSPAEIATRLRFAGLTVCRRLQTAAERDMVRVTMTHPVQTFGDLKGLLERDGAGADDHGTACP